MGAFKYRIFNDIFNTKNVNIKQKVKEIKKKSNQNIILNQNKSRIVSSDEIGFEEYTSSSNNKTNTLKFIEDPQYEETNFFKDFKNGYNSC